MSPIRVDLTMRLAARARRARPAACGWSPAPIADDDLIATVHDAGADRGRQPGRRRPRRDRRGATGSAPTTTRSSRDMHHAAAHVVGASVEAFRQVWTGESLHSANIAGGLHHAMPRPGQRLLHLQRRRGRHPVAARPGRRAGRLRRRRRPPRRRRRGDLLRRPAGADDLACTRPARCCSPAPASPATSAARTPQGTAVNVALPPGTADAGWLRAFHAVVPAAGARVRARRPGHPARLRLPHRGPARPPDADRRRPARGVPRPARPGPRGLRRAAGWPPAAAATPWSTWCRGPGRHLLAIVGGHPLDPATETPEAWRDHVADDARPHARRPDDRRPRRRRTATGREGYDPDTWLDRAIHATRTRGLPAARPRPAARERSGRSSRQIGVECKPTRRDHSRFLQ